MHVLMQHAVHMSNKLLIRYTMPTSACCTLEEAGELCVCRPMPLLDQYATLGAYLLATSDAVEKEQQEWTRVTRDVVAYLQECTQMSADCTDQMTRAAERGESQLAIRQRIPVFCTIGHVSDAWRHIQHHVHDQLSQLDIHLLLSIHDDYAASDVWDVEFVYVWKS